MINRLNCNLIDADFEKGEVLLIDKEVKRPSFSIIYKLRKAIGVKKIGHAGTLDPFASGLLIVCTGKKTKEIDSFQGLKKTYTGTITLGKKTRSMDSETEVLESKSLDGIDEQKIIDAKESFVGNIFQLPPMFSAVKHKGKALYKYARKGVEIKREPREVNIGSFNITGIDLPEVHFEIKCSKGTYVRVLANDLGEKLGCGGYLSSLRRTAIGDFKVENAFMVYDFIDIYNESRKQLVKS
jgi:tRNA pseudouridine55 synthase